MSLPRPRVDGATNRAVMDSPKAKNRAKVAELVDRQGRVVPGKMATGAKEAQRKDALKARSMAAKLDIMAKRRTDDGGGGSSGS